MCASSKKCEKGKDPKTCSPEQIKECHGDTPVHPCGTSSSPAKKK
jgi:hypothetical protein